LREREARLEAIWRALRRQRLGAITHEQRTSPITRARSLIPLEMAIHLPGVLSPLERDYLRRIAISSHNFRNAAIACPRNPVAKSVVHVGAANFLMRYFSNTEPIASAAQSETQPAHKRGGDDPA